MDLETLTVERHNGFAIVSLTRPPVNAVNATMRRELADCFNALGGDRDLNSIILAAKGDRAFCGAGSGPARLGVGRIRGPAAGPILTGRHGSERPTGGDAAGQFHLAGHGALERWDG